MGDNGRAFDPILASEATMPMTLGANDAVEVLRQQIVALHDVLRLALQTVPNSTFEYRFAPPKRASWVGEGIAWAEREFNALGSDGWELVGFLEHGTAVFKRRICG